MKRFPAFRWLAACLASAVLPLAAAAEPVFPVASPIGLEPPPGLQASSNFPGFEDQDNGVFVRLVALPGNAYADFEKTITAESLRKERMTVDKRETFALKSGSGMLLTARQDTSAGRIRKWLLIAPIGEITALVSFELPVKSAAAYPEAAIRTALASVVVRDKVPDEEQLSLLPFKLSDQAGLRLVRVVPGIGVQLTDGAQDTLDAYEQAHLVVAVAPGGPQRPADRDQFARLALSGLPPLKELHITSAEPMRIAGQAGYEVRAEGKVPDSGATVQIVQWLRFGSNAHMRILGIVPKARWLEAFKRFRAVRDGLEPR